MNGDGRVTPGDLTDLVGALGTCAGQVGYIGNADLDGNGCIDRVDLELIGLLVPPGVDVNGDGVVDLGDLMTAIDALDTCQGDNGSAGRWNPGSISWRSRQIPPTVH